MWRSASGRFLPWDVRNGLLARPGRTGRDSRSGRSVHRAVHALVGGNVAPVEAWLLLFPHQQEKGMSSVPEWMRRSDCPSRVHAGVGYTSGGCFAPPAGWLQSRRNVAGRCRGRRRKEWRVVRRAVRATVPVRVRTGVRADALGGFVRRSLPSLRVVQDRVWS